MIKLKKYIPTTPSQRNLIKIKTNFLLKSPSLKHNIVGLKTSSGRNNTGKITSRHKGGGHKRKYRKIDFLRNRKSIEIVIGIEYDPNRNSYVAALYNFLNKKYQYILSPKTLNIGDIIEAGLNAKIKVGHFLPFSKIPIGTLVHNISLKQHKKSQVSRSAGTFSRLIEKTSNYARIKFSSGQQQLLSVNCFAGIGIVSNELSFLTTKAKAGRSRWLNNRPKIRGVAMNPIDHPHGGGEGKTSGGRTSVTPWGKPTKSNKIRKSKTNQK